MKLNFCILFNASYLANGLALYNSLVVNCPDFHLYIFAFDDLTFSILNEKKLTDVSIISLQDFENEDLLNAKEGRTVSEYCFTCKPSTIKYCIEIFNLDHCTYLDSDLFFYADPGILIKEMGASSVLITPHNYYPANDQSATSGIYCAQLASFKADTNGLIVLNWWVQACITWCYCRYEDGKCFDQKYLDSWPYMFSGVHVCRNEGAGLAPWNTLKYNITQKENQVLVNNSPLIFYHFHDLKCLSNNTWYLGGYEINRYIVNELYRPYMYHLLKIDKEVKLQYPSTNSIKTTDISTIKDLSFKFKLGIYVLDLKRSFNQFISDLLFSRRRRYYKENYISIK
jgi:hypothetical protein